MTDLIAAAADPNGYRFPDAARFSGCTIRQLDYWDRTDVLWPSIRRATGSGNPNRLWSFTDLVAASVLNQLAPERNQTLEPFRAKALPLSIDMHCSVYGDWDCWLLLRDGEPGELMPSLPDTKARMQEQLFSYPCSAFTLISIQAHATKVAKEIVNATSTVR